MKIVGPADPRLTPLFALRRLLPFCGEDREARRERKLARRIDQQERLE